MLLDDIEQKSIEKNDWVKHPFIDNVEIFGTKYRCLEHPDDKFNRGTMVQHLRRKIHNVDLKTGDQISQSQDIAADVVKIINKVYPKPLTHISSFDDLEKRVKTIFKEKDPAVRVILANFGLEDELRTNVLSHLIIKEQQEFDEKLKNN